MALQLQVPIITVRLDVPGAYDFEEAAAAFADLPTALENATALERGRGLRLVGEIVAQARLQALQSRLPNDAADVMSIGKMIHARHRDCDLNRCLTYLPEM